eukprot:GDKI01049136.1.p1 GENE.GDKI01049136.1~~GDKI01049136.1.p1  ORF type:complete len:289 (+),score=51.75 GDKI01049136.1:73-939(+)
MDPTPLDLVRGLPREDWITYFACCAIIPTYVIIVRYVFQYVLKTQFRDTQKLTAWTMATLSAPIMCGVALWAVYQLYLEGGVAAFFGNSAALLKLSQTSPWLTKTMSMYFAAHCTVDLLMGSVLKMYPKEIDVIVWLHHLVYGYGMFFAVWHRGDFVVALFSLNEIANILLAIGNIHLPYRQDYSFGISWFLVRIVYHGVMTHTMAVTLWAYWPFQWATYVGVLGEILHVWWFWGWLSGKLGMKKKKRTQKPATNGKSVVNTTHARLVSDKTMPSSEEDSPTDTKKGN